MIKKPKLYYTKIRSRHPSHDVLRMNPELKFPFKSGLRLGSTTEYDPEYKVLNSIEGVKNSANKLLMKQKFNDDDIFTADWMILRPDFQGNSWLKYDPNFEENMFDNNYRYLEYDGSYEDVVEYPIVAKHIYGSRGTGNTLIKSKEELTLFIQGKDLSKYIFEKFYNFNREYRLHVSKNGYFYTCRKMLKQDTPEDKRWFRNDSNSVWILEENEIFDKPVNWDQIVDHSVRALQAVGLDIGAIDVRVQSSKDKNGNLRENPKFIILETNSAPSFGEITTIKYISEIQKLLQ